MDLISVHDGTMLSREVSLSDNVDLLSCTDCVDKPIGRVSYLIYVSMRHYVLTTSGDIVICFRIQVCLSC